jgi:adenylate kinase family enzyme
MRARTTSRSEAPTSELAGRKLRCAARLGPRRHTMATKSISYPQIILIGPTCAGKSTLSKLLAARLNLPMVSLDEIAGKYYAEAGMSDEVTHRIREEHGFMYFYDRMWPALAHATIRVLADHHSGVMDLGAGHTHYKDPILFEQVQRALAPCPNVVLVLPSPDLEQSVQILRARNIADREWDWNVDGYDFIEHWVKDECNHTLATMTVYTEGRTPDETCEEIVQRRSFT